MTWPKRALVVGGAATIVGAVFLLAFTQVSRVFVDPTRTGDENASGTVGDPTFSVLGAALFGLGFATILGAITSAVGWRKRAALVAVAVSATMVLSLHLTLLINYRGVFADNDAFVSFTAGYFFHTSPLYTLTAVFILFLLTLILLVPLIAATGHLLSPQRFLRSFWSRTEWTKNEAVLVVSSLFLILTLFVFLTALGRVAVRADLSQVQGRNFLAQNVIAFYYLQVLMVGALLLVVATRTFLINWGAQLPLSRTTLIESVGNIGRVERVLCIAALVLNLLILAGPAVADSTAFSEDPSFIFDSRGLAWFFLLLAAPYSFYAVSLRRLSRLAREGRPFRSTPFAESSLRILLIGLAGLILVAALGLGARWSPLGLMIALAAWTAGVFLVAAVSLRLESGRLEPRLRPNGGPAYFFAFLLLAITTSLMMWGAGNTFVATYDRTGEALTIENASPYGADILFRVAGVSLLGFSLLLALHLARTSLGATRSLVPHYVASFLCLVVGILVVFQVYVWNAGTSGTDDVFAGYSFHQFYDFEKGLIAVFILTSSAILFWALGRILSSVVRVRPSLPIR